MTDEPEHAAAFRLLFVCSGNTCRSPLAEAIARRELEGGKWSGVEVRSAGTGAWDGSAASVGAAGAAVRHGLDLSAHRSTSLTPELVASADLILTMSGHHLVRVVELGGGDRATLLTAFAAGEDPEGVPDSVTDPFGQGDEEYERTFVLLDTLVKRALRRLEPVFAP